MSAPAHRRLLPAALAAMGVLLVVKLAALAAAPPGAAAAATGAPGLVASASAAEPAAGSPPRAAKASQSAPTPPQTPQTPGSAPSSCGPEQPLPTAEQRAERDLLQALRARRAELDAREQALLTREVAAEATERRAAQRLEELAALQRQAAAAAAASAAAVSAEERARERERSEREEAGWKQMVKLYEGMRPRDAAAIFDDLELPVLVPLVDRLRDNKASPILGAMRPDRARALTAELARHRARGGVRD